MKTRNAAYSALTALLLLGLLLSNAFVTTASTASTTPKQTQSLVLFTDSSILANDDMPLGNGILAYGYQRVTQRRCQNATILASGRADNPITFVPHVITTAAKYAEAVYAADVDGDGDLDILSASSWNNKLAWYENNGGSPPAFTDHIITTIADHATSVYAADVDGDSDMDILSSSYSDTIAWYENDGSSPPAFSGHAITSNADGARSVYAVDLDGDSDVDVLSASELDNEIAWYENDGSASPVFTSHIITTNAEYARSVYAADVDGDGDMDILSASANDDKIAWYENDGNASPSFTSHTITTNADGARWVYAADVDGDGDMDALCASELNDQIVWYENDGGSSCAFTSHVITSNADFAHSVYATDVDGDGDVDVVSSSWDDDRITWYENNGSSPPAFTDHVIAVSADASVYAADVDKDGNVDILSASYSDGRIAWWEGVTNCEYAPVQAGFMASPTTGPGPLTVVFTNTSTGAYPPGLWNSENGVISTLDLPISGEPSVPFLSPHAPTVPFDVARLVAPAHDRELTGEHTQTLSENILINGGFEDGSYSPDGNPTGWTRDVWDIYRDTTLTWDSGESHSGGKSAKITNYEPNDAKWIQTATVEPYTQYRLSGWIKTENVAHTAETEDAGANLSVYSLPHLRVFTYGGALLGTNDWTYVSLTFNSGEIAELIIAARLGYMSGITTGTAWFDDLRLEPIDTAAPDILNPGFESGSGSIPDDWWTETIIGDATFTWDTSEAHSGSRSVQISAAEHSSVRWVQTVLVDPDSEYELGGWIRTEGVQPGTAEWTSGGAKLGIYGMENYLAAATPGLYDTHDWTQISVRFITGRTDAAKVACTLGEADPLYARSTSSGTIWCDDLTLTKIRTLPRTYKAGEHVALDIYTDDWGFEDAESYVARLDDTYEAMASLVGAIPYGGDLITVQSNATMYYALLSGNPITIGPQGDQTWSNIVNEHGIDFGTPHELGHNFDLAPRHDYYAGPWYSNYNNYEHWANFKVTYAYDVLGAEHPELTSDRGIGDTVPLAEYSHRFYVDLHAQPWIDDGRTDYRNMHNDTYTGLLYLLREQIGWQPFADAFHYFGSSPGIPPDSDKGKVELLAHTLSRSAGVDLTPHFRSWGFGVSPYIVSLWDFGDGITSTLQSPTHTYTAPGVYTITLTVGGPRCSDRQTKHVTVEEKHSVYLPLILRYH